MGGNGKQMRVRSVVKMEAKKFGQPVWMADAIKPVLVNVKSDGKVEMIADRMFFKKRKMTKKRKTTKKRKKKMTKKRKRKTTKKRKKKTTKKRKRKKTKIINLTLRSLS